jgi:G3E family GTPase
VDGFRFFEEFETIQLLHERFQSEVETPEDQRTVSDLMIDQIEFADVIIVNKASSDLCKHSGIPLTDQRLT